MKYGSSYPCNSTSDDLNDIVGDKAGRGNMWHVPYIMNNLTRWPRMLFLY